MSILRIQRTVLARWLIGLVLWGILTACDPLAAPLATHQTILVTAIPSDTPPPTALPTFTSTSLPTAPNVTATPTLAPCLSVGGQVQEVIENFSEVAQENLGYRVYLPPCYTPSRRRFPTLYLLHGANSTEEQWQDLGTIAKMEQGLGLGVLAPFIIVMPDGGALGNLNSFPPNASYETVLLQELVPSIDRNFCTIQNRDHRAIGGISRGGFWALSVAMRFPTVFGSVGGHSVALDATSSPPEHNPLELARNAPSLDDAPLRIYLDNGADDAVGLSLQTFSGRLSQRQVPHTYVIHPTGGHDEAYWSSHIGEYLEFYSKNWEKSLANLPSCLDPSP